MDMHVFCADVASGPDLACNISLLVSNGADLSSDGLETMVFRLESRDISFENERVDAKRDRSGLLVECGKE